VCECCSQHAAGHQGHIHVNGVNGEDSFRELQDALMDTPGVVSIEHVKDAEQAKVVFDKRIIEITRLEQVLDNRYTKNYI